jgi:amino-acid N-acetyltransferase
MLKPVIEPANETDLPALLALLERNGLPLDGVSQHLPTMLVVRSEQQVVGSAGLELYGPAALLRSVAVDAPYRRQGLGHELTQAALNLARQHTVEAVYLLTETAADFFPRFGFRPIPRHDVAPGVQQSVEFTSACPDSALAMMASLATVEA